MQAFVFIETEPGKDEYIKQAAQQLENIVEMYATAGGVYDLVAKMEGKDENELRNTLRDIQRFDGVTSALTSIIYNNSQTA